MLSFEFKFPNKILPNEELGKIRDYNRSDVLRANITIPT